MKKSITVLTLSALFSMAFLVSCSSPAEQLEEAKEDVTKANEKLDEAEETYLREIEEYKKETAAKIETNEQMIADFLVLSEEEKEENRAEYRKRVEALREENKALKEKLDNYAAQGSYEWQEFKQEFNEEMRELRQELDEFRMERKNKKK